MLKTLVNEARLHLNITTMGPLLIKSGYATIIGADMSPVLTNRNGQQEIYIPRSSLKGIFRSHIEKVINSIKPQVACNPLSRPQDRNIQDGQQLYRMACGTQFQSEAPSYEVYAGSCPACRLFGSTSFGSRIAVEDAYLPVGSVGREALIEHRDGIAIDRLTGGTRGGAKFDLEAVTGGITFTTAIHLRNYEIWQLGMLFVIIQDMEDELMRIGSGRSRGMGTVKATISKDGLALSSIRTKIAEPDNTLWGLGYLLGNEATVYGTNTDDQLTLVPPIVYTQTRRGIRNIRTFKDQALQKLRDQCIEVFVEQMQAWESTSKTTAAHKAQRS